MLSLSKHEAGLLHRPPTIVAKRQSNRLESTPTAVPLRDAA
jgi:hypothetical protein